MHSKLLKLQLAHKECKDYSYSAVSDARTLPQEDTLYGNNLRLKAINFSQKKLQPICGRVPGSVTSFDQQTFS